MQSISKYWPLIIALIILWLTVALLLIFSLRQNNGYLVYALDDPYIHMAIAKNFAQHGVWGVSRYEFSSSSSSLLWTFILSIIYFIFGVNESTPLILNIISATAVVVLMYWIICTNRSLSSISQLLSLVGIIFLTPLPSLIFTGQEHILHIFITILFVYLSAELLSQERYHSSGFYSMPLLVLASFVTPVRYEGLFLVSVVCVLFILRKQWRYSLFLGIFAIVPIVIYGALSKAHGWFWLPNSVLLKGNLPEITSIKGILKFLGYSSWKQTFETPHILFLVIANLILYVYRFSKQDGTWEKRQVMITIFITTTILHMQFARTGWFYRYEAYLVSLGLFVFVTTVFDYLPKKIQISNISRNSSPKYAVIIILIFLFIRVFVENRGISSFIKTPRATTNIYEQQYQMGLFLKQFYKGADVAANDIGAINYLADIHCLDLWGLGSKEVARMKKEGNYYQTERISDLTRTQGVKIAIIYDHWFKDAIPLQWIKVGEWKISNNVVCGDDTVSFYAIDPSEEKNLINCLRQFAPQLPRSVKQGGRYCSE